MLSEWLYAWVKQEPAVNSLIGGATAPRAYPSTEAPETAALPYLTWQLIDATRLQGLDGPAGLTPARVQLDCWGSTYDGVRALADAVKGDRDTPRLDGYRGTLAGLFVQGVHLLDEREEYERYADGRDLGTHRVSQDYRIWFTD